MNERAIFIEALDRDTPDDRAAYLDEVCAGDPALRGRVDALLRSHDEAGEFPGKLAPQRLADEFAARESDDTRTAPATPERGTDGLEFLEPSDNPGSLGRLKHYEVQEVVGRGGMGIVFRAFDDTLHRVVAIKVMAPQLATSASARQRFTREARAAAAVTHDHIVTIHAVEESNGLPYIVMQFVNGLSLQDRIDQTGPLSLREILRIGMQTARGLAAAHAQGLVHRDVKPANILLENGVERVKLTDFGLARAADDASLTQSGVVAGTPAFMSPEQAEGKPLDQRSDLFSLGSVLYAMCTGRPPFRAGTSMGVLKRVCEDMPSPIKETNPELPDWLVAVVEKLHAKDPAARYQSAEEVAELLGQHLAQVQHPSVVPLPAVVKSEVNPPAATRRERRNRWAAAAAVLVAVFAALGTAEATGVTQVRATVIRIFTPEGTLVVETDDPGVKVTVEGDGDLVITGAGQEVRLRAGSYRVHAVKDGKSVKLDRDLVTISRGDRQIVRVRLEDEHPAAAAPKAEPGAFVVLGGKGVAERKFDTLAEAMVIAADGDTVEVRGNGPFVTHPIVIGQGKRVIRAGAGYRPTIRFVRNEADTRQPVYSDAALTLEGLDFEADRPGPKQSPIAIALGASLHVANCRFHLPDFIAIWAQAGRGWCVVKNCEFLGCHRPLWNQGSGSGWVVDNCIQVGGGATMGISLGTSKAMEVKISRLTNLANHTFQVHFGDAYIPDPGQDKNADRLHLRVSSSVLAGNFVVETVVLPERLGKNTPLGSVQYESLLQSLLKWDGEYNLYSIMPNSAKGGPHFLMATLDTKFEHQVHGPQGLPAWRKFWQTAETGSVESIPQFKGGDVSAKYQSLPEKLNPADFRLRPDSPGYRAGKDGKDLGADVDLVGPGPAYERWKKTPEYQKWLKETGQVKK